jgi:hypothetical protein
LLLRPIFLYVSGERCKSPRSTSAIAAGSGIEQFRYKELRPWAPPRSNPVADFSCKMF